MGPTALHRRNEPVRALDLTVLLRDAVSGVSVEWECSGTRALLGFTLAPVAQQFVAARCPGCAAPLWFEVLVSPEFPEARMYDINGQRLA